MTAPQGMSVDEIALYDRQIRLWGMQAQEKIRNAKVLLVTMKALGNEIAKNLVLAGIASLTIVDNSPVTQDDLCSQFLVSEANVGQPRAEAARPAIAKLNPRVSINVETENILQLDTTYLTDTYLIAYDMVIATDLMIGGFHTLNAACRLSKRPFYAAGSHGLYGFIFADLIEHTYTITRENSSQQSTPVGSETATRSIVSVAPKTQGNGKSLEVITKHESYQPFILANTSPLPADYVKAPRRLKQVTPLLPCMRALWEFQINNARPPAHAQADLQVFTTTVKEKCIDLHLPPGTVTGEFLRSFVENLGSELNPICAFLGGHLAQDVINVLGGQEQPLQNMLFFDGDSSAAPIYSLNPIVPTTDVMS